MTRGETGRLARLPAISVLLNLAVGVAATWPAAAQERVSPGTGAVLRELDKISGESRDIEMPNGTRARLSGLLITLSECRYPAEDPAGDAYAWLTIREAPEDAAAQTAGQGADAGDPGDPVDPGTGAPLFAGWMIASSPALSALEHPRYDVWVVRCTTAAGSSSSG